MIDDETALLRVDPNRLEELFKRRVKSDGAHALARGERVARRRGRQGRVHRGRCRGAGEDGDKVVLVRRETTPDDYHGMIASQGILTSAGRTNSHAASWPRGEASRRSAARMP